jgi:hypothetical protein
VNTQAVKNEETTLADLEALGDAASDLLQKITEELATAASRR